MDDLQRLQSAILIIADEIDRICRKNDIAYTISSGTLIGSVRHKGFIPWDDDFDIEMLRADFTRFIRACEVDLDKSRFFLQTDETEKQYAFAFAKLQLKETEYLEDFSKNVPIQHGVFVDIFPLDNLPDDERIAGRLLKLNHIIKNLIWVKCGYGTATHKKKATYWIFKTAGLFFSVEKLKKIRRNMLNKFNNSETNYYFISDYPKFKRKNSWYTQFSDYTFEGKKYRGIVNYNDYLTTIYGDYLKLPPESERHIHSNGVINLGKYS